MCLDTVDEKIRKVKYGYKVYVKDYRGLYGEWYNTAGDINKPYSENKWIIDKEKHHWLDPGYPLGFHVLTSKRGAKSWSAHKRNLVIRKVLVKDIVASGTQHGFNVVVCRKKKILPGDIK